MSNKKELDDWKQYLQALREYERVTLREYKDKVKAYIDHLKDKDDDEVSTADDDSGSLPGNPPPPPNPPGSGK